MVLNFNDLGTTHTSAWVRVWKRLKWLSGAHLTFFSSLYRLIAYACGIYDISKERVLTTK